MGNERQDSVVKNIARYSSSNVYQNLLGAFTAFLRPKLLSPELYGLWSILNVIPTYASYGNFGSYDMMRYKIPYHEARKEHQRSREVEGSVFYGSLYISSFITAVLVVISLTGKFDLTVKAGLLTMASLVILQWYYDNYLLRLKAYQNFRLLAYTLILKATVTLSFSAILIYLLSIYGAFLSSIVSVAAIIIYLKIKFPPDSRSGFHPLVFKELIRQGLPIMVYNFSAILMGTSDRIVVSYFLGNEQLGYYGIAIMVFGFIRQIPGTAREVIEPRLMQDMNENSEEQNLREYLFKPLINTAYFMPLLVGPLVFILPVLIPLLLPKYISGIRATQIIIFSCYFLSMVYVTRGIIVANGWQLKAAALMVSVLLFNIGLSIVLIRAGMGINGVALSGSISYLVLLAGSLIFIRAKCRYAFPDWRTNMVGLSWPFLIMVLSILVLQYGFEHVNLNGYVAAALKVSLFTMAMVFLINRAQRKYSLLKAFRLKDIWS